MFIRPANRLLLVAIGFTAISIGLLNGSRTQAVDNCLTAACRAKALRHEPRQLSLEERVYYQSALEEVYWRHRTWPNENQKHRPAFNEVMPITAVTARVQDYLRQSDALETFWGKSISDADLQTEMRRMASETKDPTMLRELWAALNNDPYLIAECLARPLLVEREIRKLYSFDERFHGDLKQRAEVALRQHPSIVQMPELGGEYASTEFVLDSATTQVAKAKAAGSWSLDPSEWEQTVNGLARAIGSKPRPSTGAPNSADLKIGQMSGLNEDAERFYVTAIIQKSANRIVTASVTWPKQAFDAWWAEIAPATAATNLETAVVVDYQLPSISPSAACTDDTWKSILAPPDSRTKHRIVWTGSEMILWGGVLSSNTSGPPENTGFRYSPATDSWTAITTNNAPSGRTWPSAIWTGSEMIVWGGQFQSGNPTNTGGRYNPATNSWVAVNTNGSPANRFLHSVVWTGSEMIVWGGEGDNSSLLQTGGRYDPTNDSWVDTSTTGAPFGREGHSAVWTGTEMIIWAGVCRTNTGGRYNPATNTWIATSLTNAPPGREFHTGIWTGTEMIVWGGRSIGLAGTNTGGRYTPATDSWVA